MIRKTKYFLAIRAKHMSHSLKNAQSLDRNSVNNSTDPWDRFRSLMSRANKIHGRYFTAAMALSTSTPSGRPSSRIVLYQLTEDNRLVFFTNYNSRKGQELIANPRVSATLLWPGVSTEICIEGEVKRRRRKNNSPRKFRILQKSDS